MGSVSHLSSFPLLGFARRENIYIAQLRANILLFFPMLSSIDIVELSCFQLWLASIAGEYRYRRQIALRSRGSVDRLGLALINLPGCQSLNQKHLNFNGVIPSRSLQGGLQYILNVLSWLSRWQNKNHIPHTTSSCNSP